MWTVILEISAQRISNGSIAHPDRIKTRDPVLTARVKTNLLTKRLLKKE